MLSIALLLVFVLGWQHLGCRGNSYQFSTVAETAAVAISDATPTAQPTPNLATTVVTVVRQQLRGVSFEGYTANQTACDNVITLTIAAVAGINTDDVFGLRVGRIDGSIFTPEPPNTMRSSPDALKNLRANFHLEETPEDGIQMRYTIQLARSRGLTYMDMVIALGNNDVSFTSLLRSFAAQNNVTALLNARTDGMSLAPVTLAPESDSNDDKEVLTLPAIIGIAVGGACFLLIVLCGLTRGAVLFALYRCLCPCRTSVEPQDPVQSDAMPKASAPPLPPIEKPTKSSFLFSSSPAPSHARAPPADKSNDINAYFYSGLRNQNAAGAGGNIVNNTDETSEIARNGGFAFKPIPSVSRPQASNNANNSYQGLFGGSAPVPHSPDDLKTAGSGEINKSEHLPVAVQAVAVSAEAINNTDIAVAEVYIAEV